jgi:CheY-like chemotaxis protein
MNATSHILVVEDVDVQRMALERMLTRRGGGCQVETAQDGQEALDKVRKTSFDLILTDLGMPHMDGVTFTETLRTLDSDVTVVWITANGCSRFQRDAERLGIRFCLDKPMRIDHICEIVAGLLSKGRKKEMAVKHPIEYELTPKSVSAGMRWLTLRLKNVGEENLIGLDAKLNSLDAYDIHVYGTGSYVAVLKPGQQEVVPFQTLANATGQVYASLDGWQGAALFHWESPHIQIKVGEDVAELVSLFALAQPYPQRGDQIRFEAILSGSLQGKRLRLEFWVEKPGGEFLELGRVETQALSKDEQARYSAELTPEEEGMYTLYAYLYDGPRRIGYEIERVYVQETQ